MIEYDICMKSGVGGHYDSDCCDLLIATKLEMDVLPRSGDVIKYSGSEFMVTSICHNIASHALGVYRHIVYVMPTDGKSYGG